jgi:Ca2+-binding EF-hand superfamily protein
MVINDTYIEFPITHCSYYILSTKIEEPAEPEHEFQYGDVNHDGKINVTDAVMVMKHRANALTEEDVFCERCANVDTNPKINVSDAVLIMKKRANKDMVFPIEAQ